jgi:hypothetical protein
MMLNLVHADPRWLKYRKPRYAHNPTPHAEHRAASADTMPGEGTPG